MSVTAPARKSARRSVASVIASEMAKPSQKPISAAATESTIQESASVTATESTIQESASVTASPVLVFLVAVIVVMVLGQLAIGTMLIAAKVGKVAYCHFVRFAVQQLGQPPIPDYSAIFG